MGEQRSQANHKYITQNTGERSTRLLGLLLDLLLLVVEEDEREDADPGHHAERAGVVWEGGHDEPLVLVVTERDNRNLIRNKVRSV